MNLKRLFLTTAITICILIIGIPAKADTYRAGKFTITIESNVYVGCDDKNQCIRLENGTKWTNNGYRGITWTNGSYKYSVSWRENSNEGMYLNVYQKDKRIIREKLVSVKETQNSPELRDIKPIDKTQKLKTITKRNIKLEQAIKKSTDYSEIAKKMAEHELAKYFYNYIDLNGDNKPELVVHLYGMYFCGTGGCTTMIFKNVGSEYRLVSLFGVSSTPIFVTNQKTAGWNNLIIRERIDSQGNGGYFLLKFDGKTYPDIPGQRTRIRQNIPITGTELMSDIDSVSGTILRP